ncbi:DUF6153 family protein [Streptomyces sp. A5-4]|uniref:DUF6153 family protein n=1 Tax=Streptomyces sp. A5-4 TaxID=3384771 RepID=UPI003DA9C5DF
MVTALRTSRLFRARSHVAGPLQVFWLAALLLGLLYTHGVSAESAAAHGSPGGTTTTAMASSPHADHEVAPAHHGGGEAEHAAESCVSGQPQQGADLPAPCAKPLDFSRLTHVRTLAVDWSTEAGSTSATRRDPAILRI